MYDDLPLPLNLSALGQPVVRLQFYLGLVLVAWEAVARTVMGGLEEGLASVRDHVES